MLVYSGKEYYIILIGLGLLCQIILLWSSIKGFDHAISNLISPCTLTYQSLNTKFRLSYIRIN